MLAELLEPVAVAELDLDLLVEAFEALALLLAALEELAAAEEDAADELLAALDADAEAVALAAELEPEADSTVLLESITNWGV